MVDTLHRNPQALHLIDLGIQFMIKAAWCIRLKEQAYVRLENFAIDSDCLLAGSVKLKKEDCNRV
jgi:hypothetical protein